MKRHNGFTLIELMIVIAILAIIAAIAIPALMGTSQSNSHTFGANGMTETRCIEGYKFVVGASGTTSQMMDAQGNGVPCQQ